MKRHVWAEFFDLRALALMSGLGIYFVFGLGSSPYPSSLGWTYAWSQSIQIIGPLALAYGVVICQRAWTPPMGDVLGSASREAGAVRQLIVSVGVALALAAYAATGVATMLLVWLSHASWNGLSVRSVAPIFALPCFVVAGYGFGRVVRARFAPAVGFALAYAAIAAPLLVNSPLTELAFVQQSSVTAFMAEDHLAVVPYLITMFLLGSGAWASLAAPNRVAVATMVLSIMLLATLALQSAFGFGYRPVDSAIAPASMAAPDRLRCDPDRIVCVHPGYAKSLTELTSITRTVRQNAAEVGLKDLRFEQVAFIGAIPASSGKPVPFVIFANSVIDLSDGLREGLIDYLIRSCRNSNGLEASALALAGWLVHRDQVAFESDIGASGVAGQPSPEVVRSDLGC